MIPDSTSNGGAAGPHSSAVSAGDHSIYITVALPILAAFNLIFFGLRLYLRYPFHSRFSFDDALLTIATVLSMGQCAVTGLAISRGLGLHSASLSSTTLQQLHTALFTSDVLYILASTFAKLACALLIYRLARPIKSVKIIQAACVLLVLWGFASVFAITLPAGSEQLWGTSARVGDILFIRWMSVSITGIVLEVMLLALPVYLVWGVGTRITRRSTLVGAFSVRCSVIIFAALRLYSLRSGLRSDDYSWKMTSAVLFTQLEIHLSIVAATIPCFPFFTEALGHDSLSLINSSGRGHSSRSKRSQDSGSWDSASELKFSGLGAETSCSASVTTNVRKGSVESLNLKGMFIRKQTTYQTVSEDYVPLPSDPPRLPPLAALRAGGSRSPSPDLAALLNPPPSGPLLKLPLPANPLNLTPRGSSDTQPKHFVGNPPSPRFAKTQLRPASYVPYAA